MNVNRENLNFYFLNRENPQFYFLNKDQRESSVLKKFVLVQKYEKCKMYYTHLKNVTKHSCKMHFDLQKYMKFQLPDTKRAYMFIILYSLVQFFDPDNSGPVMYRLQAQGGPETLRAFQENDKNIYLLHFNAPKNQNPSSFVLLTLTPSFTPLKLKSYKLRPPSLHSGEPLFTQIYNLSISHTFSFTRLICYIILCVNFWSYRFVLFDALLCSFGLIEMNCVCLCKKLDYPVKYMMIYFLFDWILYNMALL